MKAALRIGGDDRILVFAPHPDDETLAAGDLLQTAVAAGAQVRVVFATDGDNNPWPQRWLEKRWRIGSGDRARWGLRRRSEARAALATFGLDAASAALFLGWPDQGLTDLLMCDDRAVAVLAGEIAAFAPTHVVLPVLIDRHPDHSALRVLVELALLASGAACQRLGFLVHGEAAGAASILHLDAPSPRLKARALEAHASQVALSRRRLLAIADAPEAYHLAAATGNGAEAPPERLRIDCPPDVSRCGYRLLVLIATAGRVLRFNTPLPHDRGGALRVAEDGGEVMAVERTSGALEVRLPALTSVDALYVKVDRLSPRVVIFDKTRWLEVLSPRVDR